MNHRVTEYKEKIVAFIDILGFENIVRRLASDPDLFCALKSALKRIKDVEHEGRKHNLEVSVFSDSIVVTAHKTEFLGLMNTVVWLQRELLQAGIFIRGGMAVGPVYHENGILFGEGMLSAYRLESKAAIYPRIVFSNQLAEIDPNVTSFVTEADSDSVRFINPFLFSMGPLFEEELAEKTETNFMINLRKIKYHILQGIARSTEEDHLAKYMWMADRFNRAITRIEAAYADSRGGMEKISTA
jgi:hypothetical protein